MKRSGFTMIELIFVIVILGILASVAIPKLVATRDDAKVSKILTELATLKNDLSAYYTGHGTYVTNNIKDVTNVRLYNSGCNGETTVIASATAYDYCVKTTGNHKLESIVTITPNDKNGTLSFSNFSSATGNIGSSVQSTTAFKSWAVNVQNGGSTISY